MAKSAAREIDAYISRQSKRMQSALKRVRSVLLKALPGAEEVISYKLPAIRYNGRIALYYGGWTEHYAIYPASRGLFRDFADELEMYEVGKGTIRFSASEPVPAKLIERIAKYRAKELEKARKTR